MAYGIKNARFILPVLIILVLSIAAYAHGDEPDGHDEEEMMDNAAVKALHTAGDVVHNSRNILQNPKNVFTLSPRAYYMSGNTAFAIISLIAWLIVIYLIWQLVKISLKAAAIIGAVIIVFALVFTFLPLNDDAAGNILGISDIMHSIGIGNKYLPSNSALMVEVDANMETIPSRLNSEEPVSFVFHLKDKYGKPLHGMEINHGRLLHAITVSSDLDMIAHIHPEDFGEVTDDMKKAAQYSVIFRFPREGRYVTSIDATTADGSFSKQFIYTVGNENQMDDVNKDLSRKKYFVSVQEEADDRYTMPIFLSAQQTVKNNADAYKVMLDVPDDVIAKKPVMLNYHFEKIGNPVDDFEPYLDAAMHLAIVKSDLSEFTHAHGVPRGISMQDHHAVPESFGPELEAIAVFPSAGLYNIYSQVKHHGKIITASFMVEVKE